MKSTNKKKVIFIVGPTAVGKTQAAILLAKKLNGEIISCDSMQVYKQINIASCKPSPAQLKKAPHHLVSIVSVTKEFDVAAFNKKAIFAIKKIHKNGKIPIIVGGSGLYMQILLDGIFEEKSQDPKLRDKLTRQCERDGIDSLYLKLKRLDPKAARKIHKNDCRRVIRALEICLTLRKPATMVRGKRSGIWDMYDVKPIVLNRDRAELYQKINKRVDQMFRKGLLDEIRSLSKYKLSRTAGSIIGIREIKGYLSGEYDKERAKELMKRNTRHFAKRQLTWFRKDKRLHWITIKPEDSKKKIVGEIIESIWH